jgi:quercetin dioxygenase-like cupin family protein
MLKGMQTSALVAAGLLAGVAFAGPAFAGECPADKMGVDVTKPGATEPKGVTDTVMASIDLSQESIMAEDRKFRLRKLTIEPGGVVPWHSHGDRPAIILIVQGTIEEYASNCAVPIVHKAGDVTSETHGTSHWWKNTGTETVVIYSADILHDEHDHAM